jgi:hypothetical protein
VLGTGVACLVPVCPYPLFSVHAPLFSVHAHIHICIYIGTPHIPRVSNVSRTRARSTISLENLHITYAVMRTRRGAYTLIWGSVCSWSLFFSFCSVSKFLFVFYVVFLLLFLDFGPRNGELNSSKKMKKSVPIPPRVPTSFLIYFPTQIESLGHAKHRFFLSKT